jgi:FkbM family methyltransferase
MMGRRRLEYLGRLAATARRFGLKAPLEMLRDLADGLFLRLGYPPLSVEIDEIRFHGFLRHRSFLDQLSSGDYEPATRRIFRAAIPQAEFFVDGGAHIGLFSLMAARFGKPGLPIIAIEPDPYNERALRYNVRRNGFGNIRVFPGAVSDSNGMEPILISEGSISSSLLLGRTNIGKTKSWIVRTMTMDSVLQDVPLKSLLVKLDVEGAEIMALKGMADSLRRADRFAVICEINPSALRAGGRTPADLVHSLQAIGQELFFISERENGLFPMKEPCEAKGNLLCLRNWEIESDWILS